MKGMGKKKMSTVKPSVELAVVTTMGMNSGLDVTYARDGSMENALR